jgi:hypothetical protein
MVSSEKARAHGRGSDLKKGKEVTTNGNELIVELE